MPKDDFDITDISDLPETIQAALAKPRHKRASCWANMLAKAGRPLTAREFQAAIYRQTGKVRDVGNIASQLSSAAARGHIVRVSKGVYGLPDSK